MKKNKLLFVIISIVIYTTGQFLMLLYIEEKNDYHYLILILVLPLVMFFLTRTVYNKEHPYIKLLYPFSLFLNYFSLTLGQSYYINEYTGAFRNYYRHPIIELILYPQIISLFLLIGLLIMGLVLKTNVAKKRYNTVLSFYNIISTIAFILVTLLYLLASAMTGMGV